MNISCDRSDGTTATKLLDALKNVRLNAPKIGSLLNNNAPFKDLRDGSRACKNEVARNI